MEIKEKGSRRRRAIKQFEGKKKTKPPPLPRPTLTLAAPPPAWTVMVLLLLTTAALLRMLTIPIPILAPLLMEVVVARLTSTSIRMTQVTN